MNNDPLVLLKSWKVSLDEEVWSEPGLLHPQLRASVLKLHVKGVHAKRSCIRDNRLERVWGGSPSLGHHHVGVTIRIERTVIGTMLQRVQVSAGAQRVSLCPLTTFIMKN